MIRRVILWLTEFWCRKVEQAKRPQQPELEWVKERAGRVEAEMQTAVRRAQQHGGGGAWRAR
jgi:hypothetical protein